MMAQPTRPVPHRSAAFDQAGYASGSHFPTPNIDRIAFAW
jgi:hypothetical protein